MIMDDFEAVFEDRQRVALPVELSAPDVPIAVDPPDAEVLGAFREVAISTEVAQESARDDSYPFQGNEHLALREQMRENPPEVLDDWMSGRDAGPYDPISGARYRETNALYLATEAARREYKDTRWLTLAEGRHLGATLRDGERGTRILYWIFDGEFGPLERPRLLTAVVFNGEQFDDMPDG